MSLTSVKMSEDVWLTCLNHALTTETEEIMGLLLGDIQYLGNGGAVALIWGASPQTRSDRRKDRVETNPEHFDVPILVIIFMLHLIRLHRMTQTTGKTTRVIGWYHSHPHITVLPSHVDVRTQAMYQLLDSGFIGLIFSCFSEDAYKVGRIQVTAFQSVDGKQRFATRPVMPPFSNSSENVPSTSGSVLSEGIEQDTGDSKAATGSVKTELEEFFAHADAGSTGREKREGDSAVPALMYHRDNSPDTMDSMDMSASMQEAMHRSNLDMSGAEYIRKEIPLQVLPTRSLLKLERPFTSYTEMQRVLFEEERAAYNQAISQNMRDGKIHPLAFIHHTSTYQASMCKLIDYCLSPAINVLQDRVKENEIRLSMLLDEAKLLEAEAISRGNETLFGSPRNLQVHHGPRGSSTFSPRGSSTSPDSSSLRSPSRVGSWSKKAS
ncbi:hypothetical protein H6P81_004191 [Aristolochia fimbriata]|uniref:MPN domain-containing protein n=1 Tax=Aristolochia fimbriata TaxID=158543 RepID=A0AAV7FEW2_ARIFI|nr:hypothetical protein H6P81_004191 [Aristolochia fimbriata]